MKNEISECVELGLRKPFIDYIKKHHIHFSWKKLLQEFKNSDADKILKTISPDTHERLHIYEIIYPEH